MDNKNYFELGCHFAKDRNTSIHSWAEVIHEEAPVVLQWLVLDAAMGDKELKKSLLFAKNYGIQIILQVCLPQNEESKTNFEDQVQKWSSLGIQLIMPEGSPNMKAYWGNQWARGNILSSYYQMFRFFAKTSVDNGLSPILPILVPGGDIWDTIFLQSILNQLVAENEYAVIEKLALSSPAFTYERSLDWGMGGASKWV